MTNPTCADCGCEMLPARLWKAADRGDRLQWRREGKRSAGSAERCSACHARVRRTVKPPRTCATCPAPASSSRARYCKPCRTERDRQGQSAHNARRSADAAALRDARRDPHDSPGVLLDGRWTLCPVRRVQVWQAA